VNQLSRIYRTSLSLLTDLYEITMAYGQWKAGREGVEAVFHLFFRSAPFEGGFAIACGAETALEFLRDFRIDDEDAAYLASMEGADGFRLFEPAFIEYLRNLRITCDIDILPEGTLVFPHEPLVRVRGPIIEAQIIETALLTLVNFQTLIATKAARVCLAARGEPVLEFGLRRAQGIDGGLSATRAAYVGGCSATSNVLAGKLFGIPVQGTHAHSWVMSFDSELEAFEAYASAMPANCVFLVDTYDTLDGVRHAVEVARGIEAAGHRFLGIRLDSGDLAYLSKEARVILDEGGFPHAVIAASSELDEHIISSLKLQGAKINVWGVGTKMVTASDQSALGGVYKLAAIREAGREWEPRMKLSEQAVKTTTPGILQLRRFHAGGEFVGDMIYDELAPPAPGADSVIVDPADMTRRKRFGKDAAWSDLLVPALRGGELVYESPGLEAVRERARVQLSQVHEGIKRFVNPHLYPVGLEAGLHRRKTELVLRMRDETST
jgi:nicotinate phosphoribosyltransferase